MGEKRYGIKPAINTKEVGSATTTGNARGPNDVGSAFSQDKATDTYRTDKGPGKKKGNPGMHKGGY